MAQVVWTSKANKKRIAFLIYGEKEFGRKATAKMEGRITSYVQVLAENPYMGAIEPLLQGRKQTYRSLTVHRLIKLIYRVDETTSRIYIIDLWDTRREPRTQTKTLKQ